MRAAVFHRIVISAVLGTMACSTSTAAQGSSGTKTVIILCHYLRFAGRMGLNIAPSFVARVDELAV